MIFKPSDRDLLFHHPRVELRTPVFGANPDDWWTGGIDDVLPTGHPCAVDGENLPFLGEAWSLPWSAEQIDTNTVRFIRDGVITPFRIERDMELRPGEPFVRMRHRITNVGTLPFHFIWGIHPGLPVGPATHIQIPARHGHHRGVVARRSSRSHRHRVLVAAPRDRRAWSRAGRHVGLPLRDRSAGGLARRVGRRVGLRIRNDLSPRTDEVCLGVARRRRLARRPLRQRRAVARLPRQTRPGDRRRPRCDTRARRVVGRSHTLDRVRDARTHRGLRRRRTVPSDERRSPSPRRKDGDRHRRGAGHRSCHGDAVR